MAKHKYAKTGIRAVRKDNSVILKGHFEKAGNSMLLMGNALLPDLKRASFNLYRHGFPNIELGKQEFVF